MRRPRTADGVAWTAAAVGIASAALLAVVYVLALWTPAGQHFEDGVLTAATQGVGRHQAYVAQLMLSTIRSATTLAAILVVVVVGILRRQAYTGIMAAGVIVAAALTTQVLQAVVERPILLRSGYRRDDQSFPSGHTAIGMAVLAALVLVVPHRFRWYAIAVAAPAGIGLGLATVTVGWHRPSDTVGSDLIVLLYAAAAVLLLARSGRVQAASRKPPTVLGIAAVGLCVAVVAELSTGGLVFTVGRVIVLAAGVATTMALLALVHGLEFGTPPAPPESLPERVPAAVALERNLEDGGEQPGRHD